MPSEELDMILKMLETRTPQEQLPIEQSRAEFETMTALIPMPEDVEFEPTTLADVPAEWVTAPGALDDRIILYLHGGGYAIGSIKTHREMVSRISRTAAAKVLLIDYRLAPEHPYPAALQDSTAVYRRLLSDGFDPAKMAIAGDSAGGGLTVATLVALRDEGEPLPAVAIALSPWVDLAGTGKSLKTKADVDPLVRPEGIAWMARMYVGDGDARNPLISPLYADLSGLPPMLIHVGTAEILLDDSTRLAENARNAGVNVTLEPWDDMVHVWHFFASMLPEGKQAIDRIGEFINTHIK